MLQNNNIVVLVITIFMYNMRRWLAIAVYRYNILLHTNIAESMEAYDNNNGEW